MSPTLEIRNLSGMVTGRLGERKAEPEVIRIEDGLIAGFEPGPEPDRVLDAGGAVVTPGLIDSHAHVVFGDWTPRQSALGWIESSMHGGVTMMMSASEVHLPGRPHDREGVKALALTAQRAFENFRPGGVKVLAGSVIMEPTLKPEDFAELAERGVWLAKVGFGDFSPQADAVPLVRAAQEAGFVVMNHTGGASIPDLRRSPSKTSWPSAATSSAMPTAVPRRCPTMTSPGSFEAPGAVQLVQAGNLRSSIEIIERAYDQDHLDRLVIATDTPTGTGVMPLGMIKTVCELSSLAGLRATDALALATGNNAKVLRRPEGILEPGRPADLVCTVRSAGLFAAPTRWQRSSSGTSPA